MKHIKGMVAGFLYVFCNYFIANIPCWTIRKLLYRMCGMKIGKNSRIMMKTIVTIPWKITIGNNSYVNEYCYLDGRGGLTIGDNVTVALYSMLITGSHNRKLNNFDFIVDPIVIEDQAWIAARAIILNGCVIGKAAVIGAGSVVNPHTVCEANTIYAGSPAKPVKSRGLEGELEMEKWCVHFR